MVQCTHLFEHYLHLLTWLVPVADSHLHGGRRLTDCIKHVFCIQLQICRYMQLFLEVDRQPYGPVALPANLQSLKQQVSSANFLRLWKGQHINIFSFPLVS